MAKRDKREAGKSFLENILAKVPEDKRTAIRESLLTDDIADFAGEHHLRHDEFSRLADGLAKQTRELSDYRGQLDQWKGQLTDWYTTKQKEIEAAVRTGARAEEHVFGEEPDMSKYVKTEDLQKELRETQEQGVALMALIPTLSVRHYDLFHEVLNPAEVIAHAREKGLRLDVAYDDFIKPRMDERQKKSHEEELAKARQEGAIEERKRQWTTPYPVGNQEPTTLDGLKPDFKKVNPVDAAVADYYERQRSSSV